MFAEYIEKAKALLIENRREAISLGLGAILTGLFGPVVGIGLAVLGVAALMTVFM